MKKMRFLFAAGIGLHTISAWSINGAEMSGHGAALGMGGATIANPHDSLVGASNPAGMAFVGNVWDVDVSVFDGSSSSTYLVPSNAIRQSITKAAPNLGINYHFAPRWTVGLSAVSGGAGVNYDSAAYPGIDAPRARVSIVSSRIVNSLTYKPREDLALGLGLVIGYQGIKAQGVILPESNGSLTLLPTHGFAQAWGHGFSAGVVWQATDWLTLGASYMSKTRMGRPHGYSTDLLSSAGGRIDLPESLGVGFALHPTSSITVAGDWKQIRWGQSEAFSTLFGWRNQNVVRAGVSWKTTPSLTLRAGVSRVSDLINSDDVARNVYGPGISTRAYMIGASYDWNKMGRISLAYEHDPAKKVLGTGLSRGSSINVGSRVISLSFQRSF